MEKILIFTGAGISVPLGLPSTTDFLEAIKQNQKPILSQVINYLGASGRDIEWILSTLESFKNETPFTEFLLPLLVKGISNQNETLQRIKNNLTGLKSQAIQEIIRIKKIIFEKLSKFDTSQAFSLYFNLISELKEIFPDSSISLITTNYDLTFESAIEAYSEKWESLGVKDIDFSFSIKVGRPIYDPVDKFNWDNSKIEYLKVHGSVDWHRDTRGNCSRSMSSTIPDDPDQMAILYPGFKGVPDIEPFTSMHSKFNIRLFEATKIIVIGFAFRDLYINNIFENVMRLRKDSKIFYFNPLKIEEFPDDSQVPYFIKNYASFEHIRMAVEIKEKPLSLASYLDS